MDIKFDCPQMIRSLISLGTFVMTVTAFNWSMDFATTMTDRTGGDIAMIIGAIMGPLTLLQGAVFNWSMRAKDNSNGVHINNN